MDFLSTTILWGHLTTTNIIVWSICIGANLAFFIYLFNTLYIGSLIRSLLKSDAIGEENAKTLLDIGFEKKKIIRFFLHDGSTLRSTVVCQGDNVLPKDEKGKNDFSQAKFYIPDSKKELAEHRYQNPPKLYWIPIFICVSIAIAIGMSYLFPYMLTLAGLAE